MSSETSASMSTVMKEGYSNKKPRPKDKKRPKHSSVIGRILEK